MMKQLRNSLIVMAAVAIVLALIFNELLAYMAIFVGAMVVFYGLYVAFMRNKDAEIDELKAKLAQDDQVLAKVQLENEELRIRKFNMSAIRQILDVGLFEIDTNFTRTWNEEVVTDSGKIVQFIGALKVEVVAKYGVDLTELRIKHTEKEVFIGNLQLKSLSFTDLSYAWVIAEILEHKKPYLGATHRRTNPLLELEASKIKERLQKRTHEEVKQGPEELQSLVKLLKRHLSHSISSILGIHDKEVIFVNDVDSSFVQIGD